MRGDVGEGFLGDVAAGMLDAGGAYIDGLDAPSGMTSGYCGNPDCSGACAPAMADQRSRAGTCHHCGGTLTEGEIARAVRRGMRPVCSECVHSGAA
jgi:hypothetical protein